MKAVVLALLLVSAALALDCYVDENDNGQSHTTNKISSTCDDDCEFCLKAHRKDGGKHKSVWSCGCGVDATLKCSKEGKSSQTVNGQKADIFCCKGNQCNGSAASAILVGLLTASAAVLLR